MTGKRPKSRVKDKNRRDPIRRQGLAPGNLLSLITTPPTGQTKNSEISNFLETPGWQLE
jgi:hypothetical protein